MCTCHELMAFNKQRDRIRSNATSVVYGNHILINLRYSMLSDLWWMPLYSCAMSVDTGIDFILYHQNENQIPSPCVLWIWNIIYRHLLMFRDCLFVLMHYLHSNHQFPRIQWGVMYQHISCLAAIISMEQYTMVYTPHTIYTLVETHNTL